MHNAVTHNLVSSRTLQSSMVPPGIFSILA
jgi:hypothetical protein